MNIDQFWNIIESADADSGGDLDMQVKKVIDQLVSLDNKEIRNFHEILSQFQSIAYQTFIVRLPDVGIEEYGAGGMMVWPIQRLPSSVSRALGGYISDDTFTDFCYWLVGRGRKFYCHMIENKDRVEDQKAFTQENLGYVASDSWEKKNGTDDFYDIID